MCDVEALVFGSAQNNKKLQLLLTVHVFVKYTVKNKCTEGLYTHENNFNVIYRGGLIFLFHMLW